MACAYLGLDCDVYMVKVSYEQKPFRREVMRTYGARVTPSPSETTEVGRKILAEHPGTTGSLGCAISEAVEAATTREGYRYVLGSVLSQVLLHQSIIGLEAKTALDKYGIKPDIIIGCAGGFIPSANHAGGLRYHGMSSVVSELYDQGLMEARSVEQTEVFAAAEQFNDGTMADFIPTDEDLQKGFDGIPKFPGNEF